MSKNHRKRNRARYRSKFERALKNKRRFKEYTLIQNKYIRRRAPKAKRIRPNKSDTFFSQTNRRKTIVEIPSKFSINSDIETVLFLVYKSKKIIETKRYNEVVFDFTKVISIDDGATTILLSLCYDMNYQRIRVGFNNLPKNIAAKKFIEESGFIKYFSGPLAKVKGDGPNTTIKKGQSTILQKDSAVVIHKVMKTVWGVEKRNQKLQGMLIELMTNSVNHAYLSNDREKTWYISTNHYTDQNKVEFCFVDNGDGIINTINVKFKDKYFTSNEELLERAFEGEFRSRTKLANRGRGLIVVKNNHENMTIRGLKVITNNVLLDFENNVTFKLKTPFSGTFYSWVIDRTCK
ncbi:MAG: ATP-binding protein [Sphingobacteriales bacterium]